jgi:2-hydroxy-6-oxonona-2,4-dienedioate hydrolase
VSVELRSENPALLCLPALFAGEWIWNEARNLLEDRYRVITPSSPYAHLDPKLASVDGLIGHTKDQLAALNLPEVVIAGNSLGGLIAMGASVDIPEVKAVIISGVPAVAERVISPPTFTTSINDQIREMVMEKLFFNQEFLNDPRVISSYESIKDRRSLLFIVRALSSVNRYDVDSLVERVSCPLFFIWGEEDAVSSFARWEEKLGSAFPRDRVALIPECGHSPMIEKPEEYTTHVRNFLGQIGY